MAPRGLRNIAKLRRCCKREKRSHEEECNLVRESKAMHEDIFFNGLLKEETESKAEEGEKTNHGPNLNIQRVKKGKLRW